MKEFATLATALLERYPGAPAVWTGAADAHVRAGIVLDGDQPFTARQEFRIAQGQYRRAQELGAQVPRPTSA